jgi:hypothetical protein
VCIPQGIEGSTPSLTAIFIKKAHDFMGFFYVGSFYPHVCTHFLSPQASLDQEENLGQFMISTSTTRVCFILGIDLRCGTNHLFNLLQMHPDCVGPGPIWEDGFIKKSNLLRKYVDLQYSSWNSSWEVEKILGNQEVLLRCFGSAIEEFIKLQINRGNENQVESAHSLANQSIPKILLSKTPSVENIENFFDFFPNAYLIVLVRDGRSLVESSVRSFDWNYESSMLRWRNNAQTLINFKDKYEQLQERFILVRYENLVANEKETLIKIFNYLNLNPEVYDFQAASLSGVIGSSELRKSTDAMHWRPVEKMSDFNPLTRFSNWDRRRHERFNWVAGEQMVKLGYELIEFRGSQHIYAIKNKLIDKKLAVLRMLKKALINWSNKRQR